MHTPHLLFINGESVASGDGKTLPLVNPVNETTFAEVSCGTRDDLDRAVQAARAQFDHGEWSRLTGSQRGILLGKLADLVERDAHLLADMDARCIGRMAFEPRMLDLPNAIGTLRNAAGWADKLEGRAIPTNGYMGVPTLCYTRYEAIGVVGAIVPWNSPLMITCWKLGPLLAAGCTVVVKPSEETPLSALHLAQLCIEAGIPAGVVNVVPGRGEVVGQGLVEHPLVDKITFTGSPEVGRIIQRTAGPLFKRVSLELGGKSPQIVFDDADFEAAVRGCALGIFTNQGQVCAAGSRILVHRPIAEAFGQALAAAAKAIKVGDPEAPGTTMGPVAKREQFDRVNQYIHAGITEGARLLAGGASSHDRGFFVQPTVFDQANNRMRIAREEIFGPVATIIPFDDEQEAIRLANDSEYGLGATVWTTHVSRGHRIAHAIKAGAVGINCWSPIDPHVPWGGVKTSGLGRECGLTGVLAYTEEKAVTVLLS